MSNSPAKDFGPIADDYAFFEAHTNEMERDARAYAERLAGAVPAEGPIRLLDFGGGTGTFTARLLGLVGWAPARVRLTLVEPVEAARHQAVVRLTGYTESPIVDSTTLPGNPGAFDVVLANHVLYYVPELRRQLTSLIEALSPSGVFVTAIAPRTSKLIAFWIAGFRMLGREIPYNTSEDVEAALQALGADYQKQQVEFEVTFPDTEENRMRIIRFLLADYLGQLSLPPLLDLFDQHSHSGRIDIRTVSDHFTIRSK
jgi:SAM-dependent methyltransferase